jgi:hypothetical protein
MNVAVRIAVAIAAVVVSLGIPAGAASAAGELSISVTSVAFVPGASTSVEQDIVYTNLPDGSWIDFTLPATVDMQDQIDSAASPGCSPSQAGNQGGCGWLSGSGVIRTYLRAVHPEAYVGHAGPTVVYMQAHVKALSLSAQGAITITPKADLLLTPVYVPTLNNIALAVFNLGPSASYGATITISDFFEPVTLTGSAPCHSSGKTVTCTVPRLYVSPVPGGDQGTCQPEPNEPSCANLTLQVSPPVGNPLRVTLTTVYPDPHLANNTITAFKSLPTPYTAPAVPPGSGQGAGSGPSGSRSTGSGPTAAAGATATPSPPPGPTATIDASSESSSAATPSSATMAEPSRLAAADQSGLSIWMAGTVGVIVVGIVGAFVLRRWIRVPAAPLDEQAESARPTQLDA